MCILHVICISLCCLRDLNLTQIYRFSFINYITKSNKQIFQVKKINNKNEKIKYILKIMSLKNIVSINFGLKDFGFVLNSIF